MFLIKYHGNNGIHLPVDFVVEHRWVEDNSPIPTGYTKVSAKEFEDIMSDQTKKLETHIKYLNEIRIKEETERYEKQLAQKELAEASEKRRLEIEKTQKELHEKKLLNLKKLLVDARLHLDDSNYDKTLKTILNFLDEVTK